MSGEDVPDERANLKWERFVERADKRATRRALGMISPAELAVLNDASSILDVCQRLNITEERARSMGRVAMNAQWFQPNAARRWYEWLGVWPLGHPDSPLTQHDARMMTDMMMSRRRRIPGLSIETNSYPIELTWKESVKIVGRRLRAMWRDLSGAGE